MKDGSGIFERLDDRFNPIVVRELRQAVQGKFVAAVLLLLLIVQLAAIGLYIINSREISTNFTGGRDAFMILHAIMLAICLLFVPAYTAFRLGSERSDTNVDLLFITTIRPRSIIGGKVFAALAITVLIFSACMPFMVFTYWLRGIDLPSIFVMLAFSFMVVATAIQFGTFIASIPANRVFKVLLGIIGLLFLPQIFILTLTLSFPLIGSGVGSNLNSWSFWGPACAVVLIVASMIGLLFFMSVALITPISANRALPVRLYVMIAWSVSGVASIIISRVDRGNTGIIVWGVMSAAIFFLASFAAVGEREVLGSRVLRKIPRSRLLRLPAFFLFSGAAGGIAWSLLMSGLTFGVVGCWSIWVAKGASSVGEAMIWIAGLGLYGFSYAMGGVFIRRMFFERWVSPKFTWVLSLILLAIGSIMPFLIGYLVFFDSPGGLWLLGNPFAFGKNGFEAAYLVFAGCLAGLVAMLNIGWFHSQVEEFRPPEADRHVDAMGASV